MQAQRIFRTLPTRLSENSGALISVCRTNLFTTATTGLFIACQVALTKKAMSLTEHRLFITAS